MAFAQWFVEKQRCTVCKASRDARLVRVQYRCIKYFHDSPTTVIRPRLDLFERGIAEVYLTD